MNVIGPVNTEKEQLLQSQLLEMEKLKPQPPIEKRRGAVAESRERVSTPGESQGE